MDAQQTGGRWRNLAEAFIRFAIPQPDATPESLRFRNRVVYGSAAFVMAIIFGCAAMVTQLHQRNVVDQAVALHAKITCHEDRGEILVLCISRSDWQGTPDDVRNAWIQGEASAGKSYSRVLVGDEHRKIMYDLNLTKARPHS